MPLWLWITLGSVLYLLIGLGFVFMLGSVDDHYDGTAAYPSMVMLVWPVVSIAVVVVGTGMIAAEVWERGHKRGKRQERMKKSMKHPMTTATPHCKCNGGPDPCPTLEPIKK